MLNRKSMRVIHFGSVFFLVHLSEMSITKRQVNHSFFLVLTENNYQHLEYGGFCWKIEIETTKITPQFQWKLIFIRFSPLAFSHCFQIDTFRYWWLFNQTFNRTDNNSKLYVYIITIRPPCSISQINFEMLV